MDLEYRKVWDGYVNGELLFFVDVLFTRDFEATVLFQLLVDSKFAIE